MAEVEHGLMTGFPGFIGRRLARKLLEESDDVRLTVVVEKRMQPAAAELAEPWGDRLEVVVGDIGERRLGLGDSDWDRLTGSVDTVFHLAAIYDLAVPLALAQRVNVDGTGNVIDFCRAAAGLRRHVYVSTAYVAGRRRGTVYEHELVLGQDFKNHYESTKFQAEVWVRESMADVPTTILRPTIVVGDSQTGETEKFDGPYYLLRAISQAAARSQAPMQFGRADAPFNVVPVDYVVAGMAAAAVDDAMTGETLHLVDPEPITAAAFYDLVCAEYAGRPERLKLPWGLADQSLDWYAVAVSVIMRSGPSRPEGFHELLINFASEQIIAGKMSVADSFLSQLLEETPMDADAWFLKLTVMRAAPARRSAMGKSSG